MGKKKTNINNKNNYDCKYNVTDYTAETSFFFDVTKIYPCINNLLDKSKLNFLKEEMVAINKQISAMRNDIKNKKGNNKIIEIIPEFKDSIKSMELIDRSKTTYAKKINNIIKEVKKNSSKSITLKQIKQKYEAIYKKNISLSTISRILRNHLNLHFIRKKPKNPKIIKKNYKFMHLLFLKAIMRAIKENYNIIYVDETGCYLENNNYRDWFNKKDSLIRGGESNLKNKINIIAAIGLKEIIYYKIVESSVDSKEFSEFMIELSKRLNEEQKRKSLIVLDNASYHKTKEVIKVYHENKLKIITNIPYQSEFNGIEFFFGFFKNMYYKYIFTNKKEQLEKIIELFQSKELSENLESCYIQAFDKYIQYIEKADVENINSQFLDLSDISEGDKSDS